MITWVEDSLHAGMRFEEFGDGHGILLMLFHAKLQCFRPTVGKVAIKW